METVTQDARLRGQMWQRGADVQFSSAGEFASAVKADWQRWKTVVAATGARAK